ncbi:MAG: hypothetical protein KDA71_23355 [Planctomycetales bacterium]|nr:hypothetical protein [Planctomycetales bacterium]
MLERFIDPKADLPGSWQELGEGAPTLIALAHLCAVAMTREKPLDIELSPEARAILVAARDRGVIEVKGMNQAFEAPERFLAVQIELDEQRMLTFRNREFPEITIRFFNGFRQLCQTGLVMHHLYRDFSLTQAGYELARTIDREEVESLLAQGMEFGADI